MTFLFLALWLIACQDQTAETAQQQVEELFQLEKLPQRSTVNAKGAVILRDWKEFNDFNTSFDALYTVANTEDLSLVLEDLIEKQKQLEGGAYPAVFDVPQVRSRQRVLKTFILKTKAAVEYRIDATDAATEMVDAYNTLRNQFNTIVNNTLDTNLIIDE
jgi:cell division protein YceG involved in septum cleavage